MDEDKINKTIEILLQNQAQFYADLQKTQEAQARSEENTVNLHQISHNL